MSSTSAEIYDGRRFLGHVTERDKGRRCEAFTAAGNPLGVFTSPAKAAQAVIAANRDVTGRDGDLPLLLDNASGQSGGA